MAYVYKLLFIGLLLTGNLTWAQAVSPQNLLGRSQSLTFGSGIIHITSDSVNSINISIDVVENGVQGQRTITLVNEGDQISVVTSDLAGNTNVVSLTKAESNAQIMTTVEAAISQVSQEAIDDYYIYINSIDLSETGIRFNLNSDTPLKIGGLKVLGSSLLFNAEGGITIFDPKVFPTGSGSSNGAYLAGASATIPPESLRIGLPTIENPNPTVQIDRINFTGLQIIQPGKTPKSIGDVQFSYIESEGNYLVENLQYVETKGGVIKVNNILVSAEELSSGQLNFVHGSGLSYANTQIIGEAESYTYEQLSGNTSRWNLNHVVLQNSVGSEPNFSFSSRRMTATGNRTNQMSLTSEDTWLRSGVHALYLGNIDSEVSQLVPSNDPSHPMTVVTVNSDNLIYLQTPSTSSNNLSLDSPVFGVNRDEVGEVRGGVATTVKYNQNGFLSFSSRSEVGFFYNENATVPGEARQFRSYGDTVLSFSSNPTNSSLVRRVDFNLRPIQTGGSDPSSQYTRLEFFDPDNGETHRLRGNVDLVLIENSELNSQGVATPNHLSFAGSAEYYDFNSSRSHITAYGPNFNIDQDYISEEASLLMNAERMDYQQSRGHLSAGIDILTLTGVSTPFLQQVDLYSDRVNFVSDPRAFNEVGKRIQVDLVGEVGTGAIREFADGRVSSLFYLQANTMLIDVDKKAFATMYNVSGQVGSSVDSAQFLNFHAGNSTFSQGNTVLSVLNGFDLQLNLNSQSTEGSLHLSNNGQIQYLQSQGGKEKRLTIDNTLIDGLVTSGPKDQENRLNFNFNGENILFNDAISSQLVARAQEVSAEVNLENDRIILYSTINQAHLESLKVPENYLAFSGTLALDMTQSFEQNNVSEQELQNMTSLQLSQLEGQMYGMNVVLRRVEGAPAELPEFIELTYDQQGVRQNLSLVFNGHFFDVDKGGQQSRISGERFTFNNDGQLINTEFVNPTFELNGAKLGGLISASLLRATQNNSTGNMGISVKDLSGRATSGNLEGAELSIESVTFEQTGRGDQSATIQNVDYSHNNANIKLAEGFVKSISGEDFLVGLNGMQYNSANSALNQNINAFANIQLTQKSVDEVEFQIKDFVAQINEGRAKDKNRKENQLFWENMLISQTSSTLIINGENIKFNANEIDKKSIVSGGFQSLMGELSESGFKVEFNGVDELIITDPKKTYIFSGEAFRIFTEPGSQEGKVNTSVELVNGPLTETTSKGVIYYQINNLKITSTEKGTRYSHFDFTGHGTQDGKEYKLVAKGGGDGYYYTKTKDEELDPNNPSKKLVSNRSWTLTGTDKSYISDFSLEGVDENIKLKITNVQGSTGLAVSKNEKLVQYKITGFADGKNAKIEIGSDLLKIKSSDQGNGRQEINVTLTGMGTHPLVALGIEMGVNNMVPLNSWFEVSTRGFLGLNVPLGLGFSGSVVFKDQDLYDKVLSEEPFDQQPKLKIPREGPSFTLGLKKIVGRSRVGMSLGLKGSEGLLIQTNSNCGLRVGKICFSDYMLPTMASVGLSHERFDNEGNFTKTSIGYNKSLMATALDKDYVPDDAPGLADNRMRDGSNVYLAHTKTWSSGAQAGVVVMKFKDKTYGAMIEVRLPYNDFSNIFEYRRRSSRFN